MKSFRTFLKDKKQKIPKIPSAIHFRDHVFNAKVNEAVGDVGPLRDYIRRNNNDHLHKKPGFLKGIFSKPKSSKDIKIGSEEYKGRMDDIADKLSARNNFNLEQKEAIEKYSGNGSKKINDALIKGKKLSEYHEDTVNHLDEAIKNNPLKHEVVTHSGVSFDPRRFLNEKGQMHSPSYLSTSHDMLVAHNFATHSGTDENGYRHIVRLHLKPGDPATHISQNSINSHENETIIRRGVNLQHHGTEEGHSPNGDKFIIHHMSIAK